AAAAKSRSLPISLCLVPLVDVPGGSATYAMHSLADEYRVHPPECWHEGNVAHLLLQQVAVQSDPLIGIDRRHQLFQDRVHTRVDVATPIASAPPIRGGSDL